MSHDTCPTVKIKADNEQGFIVINEEDFDETTQVLFNNMVEEVNEDPKPWKPSK